MERPVRLASNPDAVISLKDVRVIFDREWLHVYIDNPAPEQGHRIQTYPAHMIRFVLFELP